MPRTNPCPWRVVLEEILDYAPCLYKYKDFTSSHPLAQKLNISEQNLNDSMKFIGDMGLIEDLNQNNSAPSTDIKLSQKGFNVAIQIKKEKLGGIFNFILIFLTSMIWLTGFFVLANELKIIGQGLLFMIYAIVSIVFAIYYHLKVLKPLSK